MPLTITAAWWTFLTAKDRREIPPAPPMTRRISRFTRGCWDGEQHRFRAPSQSASSPQRNGLIIAVRKDAVQSQECGHTRTARTASVLSKDPVARLKTKCSPNGRPRFFPRFVIDNSDKEIFDVAPAGPPRTPRAPRQALPRLGSCQIGSEPAEKQACGAAGVGIEIGGKSAGDQPAGADLRQRTHRSAWYLGGGLQRCLTGDT